MYKIYNVRVKTCKRLICNNLQIISTNNRIQLSKDFITEIMNFTPYFWDFNKVVKFSVLP